MKPIKTYVVYEKYGFIRTRAQAHLCPECGELLNAGPNYTPKCCSECGTRLDFSGVIWEPDEELEIDHDAAEEFFAEWNTALHGKKGA